MPTSDVQSGDPDSDHPNRRGPNRADPNDGADPAPSLRAPIDEPTAAQARLAVVFTNLLLSSVYRHFIDSLGLVGDERVIDYGSGSGAAARHLVRRLPTGELTCVDVSTRWLATARLVLRRHHNVRFVLGDIRDSGLPTEAFDLVLIHWMFHDIPAADRRPVLETLVSLLRPGGRVAIREPSAPSALSDGEWIDAGELCGLLTAVGLVMDRWEVGQLWPLGRYVAGLFAKPGPTEPGPTEPGPTEPGPVEPDETPTPPALS